VNRAQPDLGPISPELALVDPELAARARALLTDPPPPPRIEPVTSGGRRHGPLLAAAAVGLATLISTIGGAAVLSTRVAAERTAADAALRTRLLESASLSASHTQTQASSATTARPPVKRADRATRPTRSVTEPTQTAARRVSKRRVSKPSRTAAPRVTKPPPADVLAPDEPPTLKWNDASAPYYDFVLWRGGERILDLWPDVPHVTLPRQWTFAGHGYRLAPGRYLWFVYPGIGPRQDARYGPLAKSGSFVISNSG
jgi:hypothetical protein